MNSIKVDFAATNAFSPLFLDYIGTNEKLRKFYSLPPQISSFRDQIKEKNISDEKRKLLVRILENQYEKLTVTDAVRKNIAALQATNSYTVTTGHQLNIFSGPLYFIYKILAVINTTEQLAKKYPDGHFIPVYWMASEDHDLEEINHFRLFNKVYHWKTDLTGPVGRMNPQSLSQVLEQLPEKIDLFERAYLQHNTLADATRYFVNELFGEYGLVVIDSDHRDFKSQLKAVMKDDLFDHHANDLVEKSTNELEALGYKSQVFPRKINLFYLQEGLRERIVEEKDQFKVLNTDLHFDRKEMSRLVDDQPELFSPNVILRPLYQEIILPNLAYIGGPAEVAYWLQLKQMFDYFEVPFPILMPRTFALYVNHASNKKLKKLDIQPSELFEGKDAIKDNYIRQHSDGRFELTDAFEELRQLFEGIKNKAVSIDQSLEGFVRAEEARTEKALENIQKRLKKAEEQNLETGIKQIENVYERLFPEGNPQERMENFLNFSINDPGFISAIKEKLDPFDLRFNLLVEDA